MIRWSFPDAFIKDESKLFSTISFFAAGPDFFVFASVLVSDSLSLIVEILTLSTWSTLFKFFSCLLMTANVSSNLPITSALLTISPSFLIIFVRTPLEGATTSRTTLSVSISARISSWATESPSFFTQFATVPSATDSGNVGDLI